MTMVICKHCRQMIEALRGPRGAGSIPRPHVCVNETISAPFWETKEWKKLHPRGQAEVLVKEELPREEMPEVAPDYWYTTVLDDGRKVLVISHKDIPGWKIPKQDWDGNSDGTVLTCACGSTSF